MRWMMAIVAGAGLFLLLGAPSVLLWRPSAPRYTAEVDYCHRQVLARISTPATARFPTGEEEQLPYRDGSFVLNGWVDAQNLFGAMVRTPYRCHVEPPDAGELRLRSFDWMRS